MRRVSSRTQEKARRRAEREAREREAARTQARRRRFGLLGGVALAAAAIVVVLVIVSSGGGGDGSSGGASSSGSTRPFSGIPQQGVALGRRTAPVTMVEFADLQCPFCAEYAKGALPELVRRYVRTGKVRMELRLIAIIGDDSETARRAAATASEQNRLWQFSEAFYDRQQQENTGYVTNDFLNGVADAAGVKLGSTDTAARRELARNDALAQGRSVNSTPSFFAGRTGSSLAPLQVSSLDASAFTGKLDQLLQAR
jgi:protein-disulfide isomerase